MPALRTRRRSSETPTPPGGQPSNAPPAVHRSRRRFLQRVRARRWRLLRRVLLAILLVAALAGGVWLVFFSSVMAVKGSEVSGVAVLSEREVRRAAQVPTGVPVATVDLTAITARVEQLAPVRAAEVSRSWPDHVRIEVTEREPVVAVDREGVWRGVDEQGVVFRDFPRKPARLPVVRMRATTSVEALAEAAKVVGSLPADIRRRVQRLDVGSIDRIVLHLRDGDRVNWGSADQAGDKGRVLQVLLKQEGSVYDVTAPGRPTVRP
jgi:cell division protein FtsQ